MATAMPITVPSLHSFCANLSPAQQKFCSLHSSLNSPSLQQNFCFKAKTLSKNKLLHGVVAAAESGEKKDEAENTFSPFTFVTDNPSSRGAIQLPDLPADDGNVGQMISEYCMFLDFYSTHLGAENREQGKGLWLLCSGWKVQMVCQRNRIIKYTAWHDCFYAWSTDSIL